MPAPVDAAPDGTITVWQLQMPWVGVDGLLLLPTLVVSVTGMNDADLDALAGLGVTPVGTTQLPPETGWQVVCGDLGGVTVAVGGVRILTGLPADPDWLLEAADAGIVAVVWCAGPLPAVDDADDPGPFVDEELAVLADQGRLAGTCARLRVAVPA